MTSRTEKDRESQRVQEVRRRSQFLAAPSWRALHRKENDWQLAKHTLPAYIPRGSRNSWDPLQGYLEQLPRSKRYCQGLAKTEHRHLQESELSSSSDSDSSGSDSDSESDAPSPVPKPWLKNASKPTWPDPAVIDILIQQACCPLDLSMETTIDDLENSCGSCCARTPRPELRSCTAVDYAEACSSSVQQQADPTQPGSFDTSCSFPLQDMDVDALAGPAVRTGYKGDWLEVSPALLQYWEKASLEPYATPKSVLYYALCPESMQGQARQFFRDLSVVYSMSNLGSHLPAPPSVPGEGPVRIVSSLVPAPVVPAAEALRADPGADLLAHRTRGRAPHSQEDKAFLEGLRAACQGLQQSLASDPPQSMLGYMSSLEEHWDAGASVVVYVLLPCSNWRALAASALFEAASCLAPATGAAGLQCPSGSSRSRLNITLQVVSHTCLGDLSGAAVRALAFTVYDKIRRQPCASDSQASQDNPPPPPTPPVIGFDFSESASPEPPTEVLQACRQPMQASSSLLHEPLFVLPAEQCGDGSHPEARTIHCCYTWGGVSSPGRGMVGRKWVAVCWTDCRGELLEARLLPGPSLVAGEVEENALRDMCNALLQETFRVAARSAAAAGNRYARFFTIPLVRAKQLPFGVHRTESRLPDQGNPVNCHRVRWRCSGSLNA